MMSAQPRPRSVQVAFWAWLAAAILLVLAGLLLVSAQPESAHGQMQASVSEDQMRVLVWFARGVGALYIVSGLAVGYLAGRTSRGDKRFRRAAVALSYAIVLLVAVFALLFQIYPMPVLLAMIALLVAAVAATRDSADAWFDGQPGRDSG